MKKTKSILVPVGDEKIAPLISGLPFPMGIRLNGLLYTNWTIAVQPFPLVSPPQRSCCCFPGDSALCQELQRRPSAMFPACLGINLANSGASPLPAFCIYSSSILKSFFNLHLQKNIY